MPTEIQQAIDAWLAQETGTLLPVTPLTSEAEALRFIGFCEQVHESFHLSAAEATFRPRSDDHADRHWISLGLLRASMDYAGASLNLFGTSKDYFVSGRALLRMQIEALARGAYLGTVASTEELDRWVRKERAWALVSRDGAVRPSKPSPNELLLAVEASDPDGEPIPAFKVARSIFWERVLLPSIHPDADLMEEYFTEDGVIGVSPTPEELSVYAAAALQYSAFALLYMGKASEGDLAPLNTQRAIDAISNTVQLLRVAGIQ